MSNLGEAWTVSVNRTFFAAIVILFANRADAQITATWTGNASTSYNNPANWDIGVVPINAGANQYNIVVPANDSVVFDVPGASNQVSSISLSSGAFITFNANTALASLNPANIDSALLVTLTGATASLPTTTYTTSRNSSDTIFSATGAGSVLNLSSLTTLTYGTVNGRPTKSITATGGGLVNLSGLTSVTITPGEDDVLDFNIDTGGSIDLSHLQTINNNAGNTNERVRLYYESNRMFSLPELTSAQAVEFHLGTSTVLNVPKLTTIQRTADILDLGTNATVNAPLLTTLRDTTLTLATGANLQAPLLTDIQNSNVTLNPGVTFSTAPLTNINNAEIAVQGGATFNSLAPTTTTYTTSRNSSDTIFSATGAGSVLNLSSLTTLTYGTVNGRPTKSITATGGGLVNLSGLTSVTITPGEDDVLDFNIDTGGSVDLSHLQTINNNAGSGNERVRFFYESGRTYSLPELNATRSTEFHLGAGDTLNLPKLASVQGGNGTFDLAANASISAPLLTTISARRT